MIRSVVSRQRVGRTCGLLAFLLVVGEWGAASEPGPRPPLELSPPIEPEISEVFLSWRAPFHDSLATDHLTVACNDTARVDTLYVGFSSHALPRVRSITATVYFHPLDDDTLGPFWFFKRGWPNQGNMLIELHPGHGFPCEMPWRAFGDGAVSYDHSTGRGRLDMTYGVPDSLVSFIMEGRPYCFARVLIRHRRIDLKGCEQPVCVELAGVWIRYVGGREAEMKRSRYRFVSWNASGGRGCGNALPKSTVRPWRP